MTLMPLLITSVLSLVIDGYGRLCWSFAGYWDISLFSLPSEFIILFCMRMLTHREGFINVLGARILDMKLSLSTERRFI